MNTRNVNKRGDRNSAVIGATCEIYAAKKSWSGLGRFHAAATCNRTCWCWWWDDRWQHGWGWGCDLIRLSLNLVFLNAAAAALLSFRLSQIAFSHCEGFHYVLWYSQHFTLSLVSLWERMYVFVRFFSDNHRRRHIWLHCVQSTSEILTTHQFQLYD